MSYYHLQVNSGSPRTARDHYKYITRSGRHSKRTDIHFSESGNLPGWATDDPLFFWASADRYEGARCRPYLEVEVALAGEISSRQRIELVREFVDEIVADRHAYSWAIHAANSKGEGPHTHAHIMLSERIRDGIKRDPMPYFAMPTLKDPDLRGSGKDRRLNDPNFVNNVRSTWTAIANEFYERHGYDIRIDERSHRMRGLLLEPKLFERYGDKSLKTASSRFRVEFNRGRVERNVERMFVRPEIVLEAIMNEQSEFTRLDLERLVRRLTMTKVQYQGVLMKVLTMPELVDVVSSDGQLRLTTRAIQALHPALEEQARRLSSRRQVVTEGISSLTTVQLSCLTEEQREAAQLLLEPRGLATLTGPTGSGRSTVLRAVKEVLVSRGTIVLGVAPGDRAAATLQRETGIESASLSTLLRQFDRDLVPISPLPVIIVEDAGRLGLRNFKMLLDRVEQHRGRIRLIGDTWLLQAGRVGEAFRTIDRVASANGSAARLKHPFRQTNEWQRAATAAVSRRAIIDGLEAYSMQGHIEAFADEKEALRGLLARWTKDRTDYPNQTQLILTETEEQRRQMNCAARVLLLRSGALNPEQAVRSHGHAWDVTIGERLRFTRSRHSENIEAGMLGSVTGFEAGTWQIQMDDGRAKRIAPDFQGSTDYGYALPISRAQGLTVDRTYLLASRELDADAVHVALTRHRQSVHVVYGLAEFRDVDSFFTAMARDECQTRGPRQDLFRGMGSRVAQHPPTRPISLPSRLDGVSVAATDIFQSFADRASTSSRPEPVAERLERWQDARSERMRHELHASFGMENSQTCGRAPQNEKSSDLDR